MQCISSLCFLSQKTTPCSGSSQCQEVSNSSLPAHDLCYYICACQTHASRPLLLKLCSSLLQCGSFVRGIPSKFPQSSCHCAQGLCHMKAPRLCMCMSFKMLSFQHAYVLLPPMCANNLHTISRYLSHMLHLALLTGCSWGQGVAYMRPQCQHAQFEGLTNTPSSPLYLNPLTSLSTWLVGTDSTHGSLALKAYQQNLYLKYYY